MKTTKPDAATRDRQFDHSLQSRYADAVENVSARTQAQLHNRLHGAMAAPRALRSHGAAWGVAAAFSLVLITVVGLQLRTPERPDPAQVVATDVNADDGELFASLEEAPDLYLWLASDDANALASE
jgi:hypothetical protein